MPLTRLTPLMLLALGLASNASAGALDDTLSTSPARIAPAGTRVIARAALSGFSDPAALLRLDDEDWGRHARSRHADNHAQFDAEAALGLESSGWRLAALTRQGGVATATADTVRLLALLNRDEAPGSGQPFELDYRMDHWRASGLSLGRAWRLAPNLEVGATLHYFSRVQLLHHRFQGQATPAGPDRMLFEGRNLRAGSLLRTDDPAKFNPFVRDGQPRGRGQALDLGARWQLADQWQLELAGFDLAARLRGRDMPESLRFGRFLYDGEGKLIGNADGSAAVQGQDSRGAMQMRPAARWLGRVGWRLDAWQVDLIGQSRAGVRQLELAARRSIASSWWIGSSITARNPALGLAAGNEWFSVSLSSSHADASQARALSLGLQISIPIGAN